MRPAREVGAAATLVSGERARRVHLALEGVPEGLPGPGRRLPGVAGGVEPERPDPASEAEVGGVPRALLAH